jgi:hypothetical protein
LKRKFCSKVGEKELKIIVSGNLEKVFEKYMEYILIIKKIVKLKI